MIVLPSYPIYLDGLNLSSLDGVSVYDWRVNSLPNRELTTQKVANRDLSILTRAEYSTKEIVLYVNIKKENRTEVEQAFLNFKAVLQSINKTLTVPQYGTNVNYTTTLYKIDDERVNPYEYDLVVIFVASDPIGQDSVATAMVDSSNITEQSTQISTTVEGSYYARPEITITINSVTGGTDGTVSVRNSATGQGITVSGDFVDGDVISIDSLNQIVTVNGVKSDYSGGFPQFAVGFVGISYVDTFTTRDVTLEATYYRKYI